ncbi:hypothetical protein [Yoonia vestfoldensis]|uniref:Dihydroorotate dehydrogenase n=1 Tax=Yoonia vestfoldensis TaxID=245188 RepID=A0A1Y0EDR3_9RHOB|nr:hypothetical protein [Yoonia vestfoldensis]ARU01491.1 hypothetical protein LOKVESSMR4R_02184 [Yoonia vestfoldensis]
MTMTNPPDDMLDDLFAQARQLAPVPDAALTARVLADAARPVPVAVARPPQSFWAQLGAMLGGWPALGGLATATIAGIWIGIASPSVVADYAAALLGEPVSLGLSPEEFLLAGEFADG